MVYTCNLTFGEQIAQRCASMVEKLGQDPAQFHVQLSN